MYDRATGTPIVADAIVSGFGETVAPRIDAVSVNGTAVRVGRAPRLDRDLPDARLRVRGRAAQRVAVSTPPAGGL